MSTFAFRVVALVQVGKGPESQRTHLKRQGHTKPPWNDMDLLLGTITTTTSPMTCPQQPQKPTVLCGSLFLGLPSSDLTPRPPCWTKAACPKALTARLRGLTSQACLPYFNFVN